MIWFQAEHLPKTDNFAMEGQGCDPFAAVRFGGSPLVRSKYANPKKNMTVHYSTAHCYALQACQVEPDTAVQGDTGGASDGADYERFHRILDVGQVYLRA